MKERKVLIVESNENCRFLYQTWISSCLPIMIVSSGEEAIKNFQLFNPDVTVMNIRLLGLDGYQLVKEIREIKPDHQIVVITGDDVIRENCFSQILKKPVDKVEFMNAIMS